MKTLTLVGLLTLATSVALPASAAESLIAGTWRGKLHGLPAVTLSVHDEGGKLSGTITFYFLHRTHEGDAWEVDTNHSHPLPLIDPRFDGGTFSFKVSHREAHPPRTLSDTELARFQMELTRKDQGELKRLNYGGEDAALEMTREKR